ncbi:GGDEF domain-containing protein [Mesorhizobium shangrilense]|uniref:diguanylate cyclase n=1 Tax=Mesorhizobium shangrilense TaxID=460060 RepID=A0ABV2DIP8_9HYPH
METTAFIVGAARTFGLAALIAMAFGWAIAGTEKGLSRGLSVGLLFSMGGVLSMSDPLVFAPGVIFDARSVVIGLSFPFAGLLGTLVVTICLGAYRLWLGGAGAESGFLGICIAAMVTIAFGRIPKTVLRYGWKRNALLGLAVSGSLGSLAVLPHHLSIRILHTAALPLLFGNIAGTMILAEFLVREKHRLSLVRALVLDASVDPLTRLLNRRGFDESAAVVERRWRDSSEGFSVVMFDVDHFKRINDTLGHQAGDEILKRIAQIVRTSMRSTDLIARYGGEEIVVLMPNATLVVAIGMAERVRSRVERELAASNVQGLPITISAGAAASSSVSKTVEAVMRQADRSLYQAKNSGRNRVKGDSMPPNISAAA